MKLAHEKKKKPDWTSPCATCTWVFLSFIYQIPPTQFSFHFREKTFWWDQRENT